MPFSRLLILLLFLACVPAAATAAIAEAPLVREISISGLYSMQHEEFLYLFDIKKGETIDEEKIRIGIKRAFLKGMFDDISVETSDDGQARVLVTVREKDIIEGVKISNDSRFSDRTIKELFALKKGQRLGCNMIEKASEKLREELRRRGYPGAVVTSKIERRKGPHHVRIFVTVISGEPVLIRSVSIKGAGPEIQRVMRMEEGDIFDEARLKRDIEDIRNYYRKMDYVNPSVRHSFGDGVLVLSIDPGKRLKLSFKGNSKISSRNLMRGMPFFEAEDFEEDIVEEAVQRMLSLYRAEGYPFAQAAPVITSDEQTIKLSFFIFEGPKVNVGNITFSGNRMLEQRLKEIMSLKEGKKYNSNFLDSDREAIEDLYHALGYLSVEVEEFRTRYHESSREMDISVTLKEGARTEIAGISVQGVKRVTEKDVMDAIRIRPGDAYNEVDISDARYRVLEVYGNKGLPEVSVTVRQKIEGQKVSITFEVEEGSLLFFGKTIVSGNENTKFAVIKREFLHAENMPFNYSLLSKERQKLYKLGLFTDVDMTVLERYDDKKDVLLKVREANAGSVELSLGYGEYELYRGMLDLSYRNIMGMNRHASLRLEMSSLEKRYVLQFYEPWFLGRDLPFRAYLLGEDRKEISIDTRETRYHLTRHAITAGFERKLSESLKAELQYEFSLVHTFDVQPDVVLSKEDTGTLIISGLRFGLVYDTRDNPFYPEKGIFSGISLEFTSPVFFSQTDFLKLVLYGNAYRKIVDGIVIAASLRGGVAQGYLDTDELPIVERFFLGGRTTVRGYDQDTLGPKGSDGNPVGGNAFLMENIELRASLGKGIGLVAFLDGGNVWVKADEMEITNLKFAAGLGLRYDTPVGPVRVDYGHKLDREEDESAGEIHFSIGHAF